MRSHVDEGPKMDCRTLDLELKCGVTLISQPKETSASVSFVSKPLTLCELCALEKGSSYSDKAPIPF